MMNETRVLLVNVAKYVVMTIGGYMIVDQLTKPQEKAMKEAKKNWSKARKAAKEAAAKEV